MSTSKRRFSGHHSGESKDLIYSTSPLIDFETSAMALVEPIIKKQGVAKALHDKFAPVIKKINAILEQAGIDKKIEWTITGQDNITLTLSEADKIYLELEAQQNGLFKRLNPVEHIGSKHIAICTASNDNDMHMVIQIVNAVVQNEIISNDEMKKVGFTLHAQRQDTDPKRPHPCAMTM